MIKLEPPSPKAKTSNYRQTNRQTDKTDRQTDKQTDDERTTGDQKTLRELSAQVSLKPEEYYRDGI